MTNAMEVRNLSCSIGGKRILYDLDIQVEKEKITSVIGPNGCGKSTLLRCMCRLLDTYEGVITINGRNINDYGRKELARHIAILTQHHTLPGKVTGRELVELGRFAYISPFRSMSAENGKAVTEAMEITGTTAFAGRLVETLSGGEQQRVWLAMALAQEPEILLLDEPGTYLDIHHQLEIMNLLRDLRVKTEMTVVIVLHDINQAVQYTDNVVAVKDGRLVASGKTADVIKPDLIKNVFDLTVGEFISSSGERVLMPVNKI